VQRFAGHRLRAARQRAGIRREAAALAVGRSYSSITLYERGEVLPPADVICRMAALYGVELAEFFEPVVEEVAA
jgi:transcriptional regulator with XRE-family HTH domain